jgi:hydroxymethylpyrimidine pyrophosphatase-like HAD family hydrolase
MVTPQVLATDLDGTLIPLAGNAQNARDLRELEELLRRTGMQLLYVTGRHLASITAVMSESQLPQPDWIIGDVGTSIYARKLAGHSDVQGVGVDGGEAGSGSTSTPLPSSDGYVLVSEYADHLQALVGEYCVDRLAESLQPVGGLRKQEAQKQSRFKLSYYVDSELLTDTARRVEQRLLDSQAPYSMIASRDPFNGDGLIDLLPRQVTKAYAIGWWAAQHCVAHQSILYAGDSGNDSAVFAAGYLSIVVANAAPEVLQAAQAAHARAGWSDRLFGPPAQATSGVLAGVKHFLG